MIVVLGSINLDLVVAVERLPVASETVVGPDHQYFAGGKGGNQAFAARMAGSETRMVGAVGSDLFGEPALVNLKSAGVDVRGVRVLDGATGLAMIGVDAAGENQIIVASGVNNRVQAEWLDDVLHEGDTLLLQMEVPSHVTAKAIEIAKLKGARVVLNPDPATNPAVSELVEASDVIVASRKEAAALSRLNGYPEEPEEFINALAQPGRAIIVTLGNDGAIAHDGEKFIGHIPPAPVEPIDTTGAGDAFVGALVAALDRGSDLKRALFEASAAGGLACTRTGAQTSAPTGSEIKRVADQLEATTEF
ncbi:MULTISPECIES: ribokinase [Pseudovibrio]|uniref:ribokinase n=1 Tax=Stappiaceae TaxID=2821832 RepID=UPI0023663ABD|nr:MULTISPECIES: ribokinase [Pseudovibrio]MDD7910068.1 ribokinase [Pseudovibrio exalbescens]MDX5592351.1 ribokinase [Pseudovibrio sp. SPO723]